MSYNITATQATYLNEVVRVCEQYRETLISIKRHADRELNALISGRRGGGAYYQMMGEALTHQQQMNTTIDANRYALGDLDANKREELLQLAVTGTESFFMPEAI